MIISTFPVTLRIRSKADALKFYGCVKHCIFIPINHRDYLRIEPDNCISVVDKATAKAGNAWMIPSMKDDDGSIAYQFRKVINDYLKGE